MRNALVAVVAGVVVAGVAVCFYVWGESQGLNLGDRIGSSRAMSDHSETLAMFMNQMQPSAREEVAKILDAHRRYKEATAELQRSTSPFVPIVVAILAGLVVGATFHLSLASHKSGRDEEDRQREDQTGRASE